MDIDSEHLGIPDTDYSCVVKMPSSEFQRICREITIIGDTVKISATKEGVKFQVAGDMGNGSIICKQNASVDEVSFFVFGGVCLLRFYFLGKRVDWYQAKDRC